MSQDSTREYYDESYHFAEDVERPNRARTRVALREIEPLAGTRLLDLGCGAGLGTRMAIEEGRASLAVGLDFSWTALALARRTSPVGAWIQGDGTTLPFRDGAFDRVFSHGSMEHFPDVAAGFRELQRVMAPGARAVIVVPNFWVKTEQPLEFRADQQGWTAVIERAGLRVLRVGTDSGPAILKNLNPLRILMRIALRVVSLFPPLRYQHVFVLEKPAR